MKKWRMEKIVCVFLAAVLIFGAGGCSGKEDIDESVTEKEDYVTETLFCDVNYWTPPAWDISEDSITGKISEKTGVQLNTVVPSQDADFRLKIMMTNDELPDLISVTDSTVISQLATSDKVWKLDEFLEKYKPDSHLLKDFPEDLKKEMIRRDGAWYALPSHMNSEEAREYWKQDEFWTNYQNYSDNNAIIWNKKLLEEFQLNTEQLQTEEEVLSAFAHVLGRKNEDGNDVIPLLIDGKSFQDPTMRYLEGTFGAEWVDDDGNYRDIILQPQTKEALAFLNTSMQKGYITSNQLTMENTEIKERMAKGNVFCFIGNVANTGIDNSQWISTGVVLSGDGSIPIMGKEKRASGWMSTFVSKSCSQPEKLAEFLDYMTSEEGMMTWYYGEKGEDYTQGEDGKYYRTKQGKKRYDDRELGIWWMFENLAWERSVQGMPQQEKEDMYQVMGQYGSNSQTVIYDASLLPTTADALRDDKSAKEMQSEITSWKEDCITRIVLAEDDDIFETEYEKMIQGLYERGIEQLDEIKNKAYQEKCRIYGESIEKVNKEEGKAETK